MGNSKDAADVTNTPAGLDVAVTEPGTIVGAKDLQGTDGTERTDRPGEILGTPVTSATSQARRAESAKREADKADFVTSEVDRANREELPLLGGPIDDGWERAEAEKATKAARDAAPAATRTTERAPAAGVTTANVPAPAAPRDSGIKVGANVDRGKG